METEEASRPCCCEVHRKLVNAYCNTCDKLTCKRCYQPDGEHYGHAIFVFDTHLERLQVKYDHKLQELLQILDRTGNSRPVDEIQDDPEIDRDVQAAIDQFNEAIDDVIADLNDLRCNLYVIATRAAMTAKVGRCQSLIRADAVALARVGMETRQLINANAAVRDGRDGYQLVQATKQLAEKKQLLEITEKHAIQNKSRLQRISWEERRKELIAPEVYSDLKDLKEHLKRLRVDTIARAEEVNLIIAAGGVSRDASAADIKYNTSNKTWWGISPIQFRRQQSAAATLNNNLVVAGGRSETGEILSTVELYNPVSNVWSPLPDLNIARCSHGLVSLGDRILAIGGTDGTRGLPQVESYKPGARQWQIAKNLLCDRYAFASAVNGNVVIVAGGKSRSGNHYQFTSSCVMYTAKQRWCTIEPLNTARGYAAAAAHSDFVYVYGGRSMENKRIRFLDSIEQYDCRSDKWTIVADSCLTQKRCELTAVAANNLIYVIGGSCGAECSDLVEVFNPVTGKIDAVSRMPAAIHQHASAVVQEEVSPSSASFGLLAANRTAPDKLILIVGGKRTENLNTATVYDHKTNCWSYAAPMSAARLSSAAATLDGNAIITGGMSGDQKALKTVKKYDVNTRVWTQLASLLVGRQDHALVSFDSALYALGGLVAAEASNSVECYNPTVDRWSRTRPLKCSRISPAAAALKNGILVAGGRTSVNGQDVYLSSCELYDPSKDSSDDLAPMKQQRAGAAAAAYADKVYVFGGQVPTNATLSYLDSAEQFNPTTGSWTLLQTRMKFKRAMFGVICQNKRIYVVGGSSDHCDLSSVEACDVTSSTISQFKEVAALDRRRTLHATASMRSVIVHQGSKTIKSPYPIVTDSRNSMDTWNTIRF